MKQRIVFPLLAWQLIVLGILAVIMVSFGKSLNVENEQKLGLVAGLGLIVVLLCWPICRLLPRAAGWIAGAMIGLLAPALCAWTWAWLLPFPWWTDSSEVKLLGIVISLPSALGGMVVGGLQARSPGAE